MRPLAWEVGHHLGRWRRKVLYIPQTRSRVSQSQEDLLQTLVQGLSVLSCREEERVDSCFSSVGVVVEAGGEYPWVQCIVGESVIHKANGGPARRRLEKQTEI